MNLLEYLATHKHGETANVMVADIENAQAAKQESYMGLKTDRNELLRQLRVLKAQDKVREDWPTGATEAVWRIGRKAPKAEPQKSLW